MPAGRPSTRPTTRLGRELRRVRGTRTIDDVAAALSITPGTWRHWERGRIVPKVARLKQIAKALGCDLVRLVEACV